ncbi:hypothetical protein HMPREF0758_3263 [Serratia odorifera DSM 4582]|uniref:Uncharacterized protein n=1 Tax=Serratia odorifera DSM 4582 TaxID=667129 RepID=D4E513_SEROD|nr:hypothetical protein HMPREF0758_3263 [Serratia odorifera DSM 4582]
MAPALPEFSILGLPILNNRARFFFNDGVTVCDIKTSDTR